MWEMNKCKVSIVTATILQLLLTVEVFSQSTSLYSCTDKLKHLYYVDIDVNSVNMSQKRKQISDFNISNFITSPLYCLPFNYSGDTLFIDYSMYDVSYLTKSCAIIVVNYKKQTSNFISNYFGASFTYKTISVEQEENDDFDLLGFPTNSFYSLIENDKYFIINDKNQLIYKKDTILLTNSYKLEFKNKELRENIIITPVKINNIKLYKSDDPCE